jgi:hypothetical protein
VRYLFVLLISVFCGALRGQTFGSRSAYEKRWAIFHPFAALKVKKIYKQCKPLYIEAKRSPSLDTLKNGGRLDAFRHVFFMAAFSQKIKAKKVRKLGVAHEKGNYKHFLQGIKEEGEIPDSLSTVMDLFNNEVGIRIGVENKKTDLNTLMEKVINEISEGKALNFKRNTKGSYLSCDGEEVVPENYPGKWYIPKCLVKTNEP